MRPIATDVTRSVVCVCVFVSWSHGCAVKNGWTDRDAVWKELYVRCGSRDKTGRIYSQPR